MTRAYCDRSQKEAWHVEYPVVRDGGTFCTAGGPVFQRRADGELAAYGAAEDALKWKGDVGAGIAAAPMTYAEDGVRYVAILSAPPLLFVDPTVKTGPGRLLVFALDGKGTIPKVDRTVPPVVMPRTVVNATSRELAQGAAMYTLYCDRCHSADLNLVKSGAIPELRRATAETHAQFQEIARGGKRRVLDMPSFAEDMTADQARMIEAYVLVQARRGAGATIP